jgi:L-iditol 2-dehydrogenase
MSSMLAAVLYRPGDVRVERRAVPDPGAGEVLVRIRAVGVCGSDVHYYAEGRIGRYVVERPLILGHECAGEVVRHGPGVSAPQIGTRVALEPGAPCRRCRYCQAGRYNLCPQVVFMGTPPVDGAFAEYVAWPADLAFPLPENVSLAEGALIEPLAVGMHAMRRASLVPGATLLIQGAGPIGQMTLLAARAAGAGRIFVTDLDGSRLAVAKNHGADAVLNPVEGELREALADLTDGDGVDVVVEAAGSAPTIRQSLELVRRGGTIVWIGLPANDPVEVSALQAIDKEVTVFGVFRYANVYADAIRLVAAGRIPLGGLVTHRLPLSRVGEALALAGERMSGTMKVLVEL